MFLDVFFDKISFLSQTVNFGLQHVIHILKALVPADNFSYQKTLFQHPTRRQIFANTVGWKKKTEPPTKAVSGNLLMLPKTIKRSSKVSCRMLVLLWARWGCFNNRPGWQDQPAKHTQNKVSKIVPCFLVFGVEDWTTARMGHRLDGVCNSTANWTI